MTTDFRDRIEAAYQRSGNALGWRFLYSPAETLQGARIAFLGLNPGGSAEDDAHATYAMESGSAYSHESWVGCAPGESRLQRQVLALFERLDTKPEHVLAGNLVPFRSRDWQSLKNPEDSVQFGTELWEEVLRSAKPALVITMGSQTRRIVVNLLGIEELTKHDVGWGRVAAYKGRFDGGRFVGLPHLSRFGIITRPQSTEVLDELLPIKEP
ncbi:uracil-DNA glycosylase family protein [Antarcticimicrobium luteum]|nr:uracil-DNA glycosylase family protein [Antarcticimicrobium luteum]